MTPANTNVKANFTFTNKHIAARPKQIIGTKAKM
jgi:hypothetical protein